MADGYERPYDTVYLRTRPVTSLVGAAEDESRRRESPPRDRGSRLLPEAARLATERRPAPLEKC